MDFYKFSASDLVKRSASQIKYFIGRKKGIHKSSDLEKKGILFQSKEALKLGAVEEFRGTFCSKNIVIYFCNDLVTNNKIIEVKSITGTPESWYFEISLLQTAFYKSLLMLGDGILFTPKFRIKQGFEKQRIQINPNIPYHLLFGDNEYHIIIKSQKEATQIVNFFIKKANIIINSSWQDVKKYDFIYKFKEYEKLKSYFTYKLVK